MNFQTKWMGLPANVEFFSEEGPTYRGEPRLKVCVSLVDAEDGDLEVNGIGVQGNARIWLRYVHRADPALAGWYYHDCTLWRTGTYAENVTDNMRQKMIETAVEVVVYLGRDLGTLWRDCEVQRLTRELERIEGKAQRIDEDRKAAGGALIEERRKSPYTPWSTT